MRRVIRVRRSTKATDIVSRNVKKAHDQISRGYALLEEARDNIDAEEFSREADMLDQVIQGLARATGPLYRLVMTWR